MKRTVMALIVVGALAACETNGGEEVGETTEIGQETEMAAGEMAETVNAEWDADASGYVEENEFDTWWSDNGVYGGWDADGDGVLAEAEFGDIGLGADADFAEWDIDASGDLTETEVQDGVFNLWDRDDDNRLTNDEWMADDWGDQGILDV